MSKPLLLGCIADDFTGATDLANNLVRAGMRVVQTIGVPTEPLSAEVDAVVVALKSRTIAPQDAIDQSLQALQWLQGQGAQQIYFKYCSTFDSTIATPAFPDNGRTVFKGYLFVGDVLLNESGMQHHPLTPMVDANLVRVMQAQCKSKVGLLGHKTIAQGPTAISQEITNLKQQGVRIAIVDAVSNDDLMRLGPALRGMPLVTAGSGVAIGLPQNFGLSPTPQASVLPKASGLQAVVSGSCSQATNRQVAHFKAAGRPAFLIDPLHLKGSWEDLAKEALAWAQGHLASGPVLVYSTATPESVKSVQSQLGVEAAGHQVEQALAAIARGLVELGVKQLVVAGGETSGACVQALSIEQLKIGPQIDPGVPWCHAHTPMGGVHITLKSGNFGTDDFFTKAFTFLLQQP